MALYAIADLHLSTLSSTNKSMEVFGHRWQDYTSRIEASWKRLVGADDTVVVGGDISWALTLEEATEDIKFIDRLPGKKIFLKGNHDFWWSTMKKHAEHFERNGITTVSFLFNNAHECEDFIIAGTRGWFFDEKNQRTQNPADFDKLVAREILRFKTSLTEAAALREATGKEIIAFMHFPPVFAGFVSEGLISLMKEYGVKRLYYGHIHGNYTIAPTFTYEGIEMSIISADYLSFVPKHIDKRV